MKGVKGITSLSYGAIACNTALIVVLYYNSGPNGSIQLLIASIGVLISILYAVQLIRMNRAYYGHRIIGISARGFAHIFRIIQLLYSLLEIFILVAAGYDAFRGRPFPRSQEYKLMIILAVILVTVVMNLTIFFKGWRLLKIVRKPYIDLVMASFD